MIHYQTFFSKMYRIRLLSDIKYNFVWIPFNLREYRQAHLPFEAAFRKHYDVSLNAVLAIVAALSIRVQHSWIQTRGSSWFKYHQRAYEGPCKTENIRDEIQSFLPDACDVLGIDKSAIGFNEVQDGIDFWSLNNSKRVNIDLAYSGPHYLFLPIRNADVFVNYAWILRRLHDLFVGISIPNQSFKGSMLEAIIRKEKSALPSKPCKIISGEKRQIDFATIHGRDLIIVECKAASQSIGFDRGDPRAIAYRTERIVKRALSEVDEKAGWLASHPVGTNYDVTKYDYILPVAVSPFVEFIPSQDKYYWISEDIPRVLTPAEFQKLMNDIATLTGAFNKVKIINN